MSQPGFSLSQHGDLSQDYNMMGEYQSQIDVILSQESSYQVKLSQNNLSFASYAHFNFRVVLINSTLACRSRNSRNRTDDTAVMMNRRFLGSCGFATNTKIRLNNK